MGEKNLLRQLANLHRPQIICFSYTHTLSTLLPIHRDTFALHVVVSCTAKNTLQLNTCIFAQASYHLFLLHTHSLYSSSHSYRHLCTVCSCSIMHSKEYTATKHIHICTGLISFVSPTHYPCYHLYRRTLYTP